LSICGTDLSGNIGCAEETFTASSSPILTTGGGGSTEIRVSVVALLKPADYTSLISDLKRAILYSRIKNYSELTKTTDFSQEQLNILKNNLSSEGITLSTEELNIWIKQLKETKIESVLVSENEYKLYGLTLSTIVILPSKFSLIPLRIDTPWLNFNCNKVFFETEVKSTKFLSDCSIESSSRAGFNCVTQTNSSNAKISYTEETEDYFSNVVEGVVRYTSMDSENNYQNVRLNIYNLCYQPIKSFPLFRVWMIIPLFLIISIPLFYISSKTKSGGKVWFFIKKQVGY
jgi:hypothetical protein